MTSGRGDARPACFFAGRPGAGPCDGALIRAHLIPKQRIRRERETAESQRRRGAVLTIEQRRLLDKPLSLIVWDPAVWVPVCGGAMGNAGHHGAFDSGGVRKLELARRDLPMDVEVFALYYGLGWSLEQDYGLKELG